MRSKRTSTKKGRKVRTKSYARLKRDLDAIVSIWVRRSNADRNGNVSCYTCQSVMHWKQSHAGHWIPRHHLATRWRDDLGNIRVQCPACNLYRKGQPHIFARNLMDEFGPQVIDQLIRLSKETRKYTRSDLSAMIQDYTEKVNALGE